MKFEATTTTSEATTTTSEALAPASGEKRIREASSSSSRVAFVAARRMSHTGHGATRWSGAVGTSLLLILSSAVLAQGLPSARTDARSRSHALMRQLRLPASRSANRPSQLRFSRERLRERCGVTLSPQMQTQASIASEGVGSRDFAEPEEGKLGVILLNLGGPETLEDVEPFLYNLFADPDIIRLPGALKSLQPLIAKFLSSNRAPKSKEAYQSIGGGSPLRKITEEQASALEESLKERGQDAKVYVAMRYWKPFTEDSIEQIKEDGIKQLVILPLYPQFSISTSGSSLRLLSEIFKEDQQLADVKHTVIPSWYQRPGYVNAMCDLIEGELSKFKDSKKVEIFFSAHGVPKSYVEEAFDPYQDEMEHSVQLIMSELRRRGVENHETLAYQSRVGPVEWLQPYTEDAIQDLAENGVNDLLVVPISFVNEHIETLEEIDMEYREVAEEAGIENWGRVPALNSYPGFIDDLAQAVLDAKPYIGSISSMSEPDALVPGGDVDELMSMYDNKNEQPLVAWEWGWTKNAETINGRIAMMALAALSVFEVLK